MKRAGRRDRQRDPDTACGDVSRAKHRSAGAGMLAPNEDRGPRCAGGSAGKKAAGRDYGAAEVRRAGARSAWGDGSGSPDGNKFWRGADGLASECRLPDR